MILLVTAACLLEKCTSNTEDCDLQVDGTCRDAGSSCGLYMAESAIPGSGLGMYTARPIGEDERIFYGDIVCQVEDFETNMKLRKWFYKEKEMEYMPWLLDSYFWNAMNSLGLYEADDVQSIIPGLGMLANSHTGLVNSVNTAPQRVAQLHRGRDPGAGASTTYHDVHFVAGEGPIEAGAELFVEYGDTWFKDRSEVLGIIPLSYNFKKADKLLRKFDLIFDGDTSHPMADQVWDLLIDAVSADTRLKNAFPQNLKDASHVSRIGTARNSVPDRVRSLEWLEANGRCLDNIQPGISTAPQAGRGAFATRAIPKGSVIAPLPLVQVHRQHMEIYDADDLKDPNSRIWREGTQLLLNYCYGHKQSSLLFFPYSPVVNYVNHHKIEFNAELKWSDHGGHHADWLEKTPHEVLMEEHTGLIMEMIAKRDIAAGEEIFLNYGEEWDQAWEEHVANWKPRELDKNYVSAAELNERNETLRTMAELKNSPYDAKNALTGCFVEFQKNPSKKDGKLLYGWKSEPRLFSDGDKLYPCDVLEREEKDGETYYTVGLEKEEKEEVLVENIPRYAIQFFDAEYTSDLFLRKAFRHEILIPDAMFPDAWRDIE